MMSKEVKDPLLYEENEADFITPNIMSVNSKINSSSTNFISQQICMICEECRLTMQPTKDLTVIVPKNENNSSDPHGGGIPCLQNGTITSAVYILCSYSLGVGIFVIPSVMNLCGIALGIILIFLIGFIAASAQVMLVRIAKQYEIYDYAKLAERAFGPLGKIYLAITISMTCFIANCSHIATVGELFLNMMAWFVVGDSGLTPDKQSIYSYSWYKRLIIFLCMLAVSLPYTFQKSLTSLKHISALAVFTTTITSLTMVFWSIDRLGRIGDSAENPTPQFICTMNLFRAIPAICFAYSSVVGILPLYEEIQSYHNSEKIIHYSIYISSIVCSTFYALVGLFICLLYGKDTTDNAIYNIPLSLQALPYKIWFTFCCFCMVLVIVLLYPVINFPIMKNLELLLFSTNANQNSTNILQNFFQYYCWEFLAILIMIFLLIVDLAVTDLVSLFGLCGSLGLGSVAYILPGLMFLYLNKNEDEFGLKLIAGFVFLFGLVITLFSTGTILAYLIE